MEASNDLNKNINIKASNSDIDKSLDKVQETKMESVIKQEEQKEDIQSDQDKISQSDIKQEQKEDKQSDQDKIPQSVIKQEQKEDKQSDQDKISQSDIKQEQKEDKQSAQKLSDETKGDVKSSNKNLNSNTNNESLKNSLDNKKSINTDLKAKAKPVKELPIEKKPFNQFINDHLIPELKIVFNEIGKEISSIYISKTNRPVAEDECWVIYCEIKDTCRFWLSFNKDDILSPKSFTLCKTNEQPSVLESFLIDEKKITLKLIISRILQRLNGQKLIGAN